MFSHKVFDDQEDKKLTKEKTYEGNKEKTYEGDEEKNLQAVFSTGPPPKSSKYKKVDQG